MSKLKVSQYVGVVVTLAVSGVLAAAIWTEPLTSSFTIGGHLGATAGLVAACSLFVALFTMP